MGDAGIPGGPGWLALAPEVPGDVLLAESHPGGLLANHYPHDCGAISSITGEDRSGGDIRARRDLRSVPGAADLIEIEGFGKVPLRVDLRFQIGNLLLRSGNGVNICRQLEDSVIQGGQNLVRPRIAQPPGRIS